MRKRKRVEGKKEMVIIIAISKRSKWTERIINKISKDEKIFMDIQVRKRK